MKPKRLNTQDPGKGGVHNLKNALSQRLAANLSEGVFPCAILFSTTILIYWVFPRSIGEVSLMTHERHTVVQANTWHLEALESNECADIVV